MNVLLLLGYFGLGFEFFFYGNCGFWGKLQFSEIKDRMVLISVSGPNTWTSEQQEVGTVKNRWLYISL